MGDRYRLGIDPGQRYIGLAVVRIPNEGPAEPVYLLVVDLGHGQDHIRHRIYGRARNAVCAASANAVTPACVAFGAYYLTTVCRKIRRPK